MADELSFRAEAAAEYDRALSHVAAHFLPFLLRSARLAPGQRVLDVATGTGIAAEAALEIVGSAGSVLATDMSPEMVEKACVRLRRWARLMWPLLLKMDRHSLLLMRVSMPYCAASA